MSDNRGAFRGAAGEVVRGFVHAATLATALAVLLASLVVALATALIIKVTGLSPAFGAVLLLLGTAPIVGRFALAAREGHLDAGFLTSEVDWGRAFGFGLRYGALCLAWAAPLAVVCYFLFRGEDVAGMAMMAGGFAPSGGKMLVLMVVATAAIVGQVLSLLVATKVDSVGDAFTGDAWRWVLVERRADLIPFVASLIGGVLVFALLLWPALGLVSLLVMKASTGAGAALAAFTYAAPMLAAPVLLGRMCGAFVFGEDSPDASTPAPAPRQGPPLSATVIAEHTPRPALTSTASAAQAARRVDVNVALDSVKLKAATDLAAAIKEAEILREAYPANPRVAVLVAQLLLQAGRQEEAVAAGGRAIRAALNAGTAPLALEMWTTFTAKRDALELDADTLEPLAKQLVTRKELRDAAWCFQSMKTKGADDMRVQRGLISVAEAAARDGDKPSAAQIYRFILKAFPESSLREYIQNAIAQLER